MTPRHSVPESCIRPLEPGDVDAVCALSLRAWEPVFSSFRAVLGERVYLLLYPDWQASQAAAVRRNCLDPATSALVVEHDGEVAGFAVLLTQDDPPLGVVDMIAVDPAHQRRGLGRRLVDASVAHFAAAGLPLVNIGTGGDPGHAPARALYESAGFERLPLVSYFRAIETD